MSEVERLEWETRMGAYADVPDSGFPTWPVPDGYLCDRPTRDPEQDVGAAFREAFVDGDSISLDRERYELEALRATAREIRDREREREMGRAQERKQIVLAVLSAVLPVVASIVAAYLALKGQR